MDISVIIPLYNKERSIEATLRSVCPQLGATDEVVVVDDGSTDASVDRVRSFDGSVVLIEQANAGPSAARNTGARHARGTHLLFLDADDRLLPCALEQHRRCIASRESVDVSLASFQRSANDVTFNETVLADRVARGSAEFEYVDSFDTNAVISVPSGSICVSRRLHDAVGGWDEELHCWEVTDYLMRAAIRARRTGLHRTIGLTVYLTEASQFSKAHRQVGYQLAFARKVAGLLQDMPVTAHRRMRGQILNIAREFWQRNELEALHRLSACLREAGALRRLRHPLVYAGLLPVQSLRLVRGFARRPARSASS